MKTLNKNGIVILPVLAAIVMIGMVVVANYQLLLTQMTFAKQTEIEMEATQARKNVKTYLSAKLPAILSTVVTNSSTSTSSLFSLIDDFPTVNFGSVDVALSASSTYAAVSPNVTFQPYQVWGTVPAMSNNLVNDPIASGFPIGQIMPVATNGTPPTIQFRLESTTVNNRVWTDRVELPIYELSAGAIPFVAYGDVNTISAAANRSPVPVVLTNPPASPSPTPIVTALVDGDVSGGWGTNVATILNIGNAARAFVFGDIPRQPTSTTGISPSYSIPSATFSTEGVGWTKNNVTIGGDPRDLVRALDAATFRQAIYTKAPASAQISYRADGNYSGWPNPTNNPVIANTNVFISNRTYAGVTNGAPNTAMFVNLGRMYDSTNNYWHVRGANHVTLELPEAVNTTTKNTNPMVVAVDTGLLTVLLARDNQQARPVTILTYASDVRLLCGWNNTNTNTTTFPAGTKLWGRLVLLPPTNITTTFNSLSAFGNVGQDWSIRPLNISGGLAVAGDPYAFPISKMTGTDNKGPSAIVITPDSSVNLKNFSERIIYGTVR